MCDVVCVFFFFKQKTAYEMRISDWSSDVCSSDLAAKGAGKGARNGPGESAARRGSHPGKKAVLIHIPADMHRTLRQLSVEEGGEAHTAITERLLRQILVQCGSPRVGSCASGAIRNKIGREWCGESVGGAGVA